MKTRVKLLLAGAALVMTSVLTTPAEASICQAQPYNGIYSESECASYCYWGGCWFYEFTGDSCYCS